MSLVVRAAASVYVRHLKKDALRGIVLNGASTRGMASLSGGQMLSELTKEYPHKNAIRFDYKNQKFSFKDLEYHSDCLACGFTEQGFQPGDKVLSWLPLHFSEQVMLELACSKAGFILFHLDPAIATKSERGAKVALKQALELSEANIFITQEAGSDVHYVNLVKDVIPEIRLWEFGSGLPFFSYHYPHLRYPIHTGFDHKDKLGMIPYRHMIVDSGFLQQQLEGHVINGETPLYGELIMGSDRVHMGKVYTNTEVMKDNLWPTYCSILKKEYLEIQGIGNIW